MKQNGESLGEVRAEAAEVLGIIHDYEKSKSDRDSSLEKLMDELHQLLPEEQYNVFEKYMKSIPELEPYKKAHYDFRDDVDWDHPLESLQRLRNEIASEY